MKFRMFTDAETKLKVAVNVDKVRTVYEDGETGAVISLDGKEDVYVAESYDVVLSRLNIIAE